MQVRRLRTALVVTEGVVVGALGPRPPGGPGRLLLPWKRRDGPYDAAHLDERSATDRVVPEWTPSAT